MWVSTFEAPLPILQWNRRKKSFNIAVDYGENGQRLYGYKTLNLLNGHVDASFLREVLYNRIARDYIPAMKTNFVKLVINGENWGVYINLQQYNKDFLAEWFGTKDGVRWKVGPGRGGCPGLRRGTMRQRIKKPINSKPTMLKTLGKTSSPSVKCLTKQLLMRRWKQT